MQTFQILSLIHILMDGAVTVLLSESDNDYGIAAQVRSSEKITCLLYTSRCV